MSRNTGQVTSRLASGRFADVLTTVFEWSENVIGKGGFGVVFKAQLKAGLFAVKLIRDSSQHRSHRETDPEEEGRMMLELKHANIITLFDFGYRGKDLLFVMEFADGGDLCSLVKKNKALGNDLSIKYGLHIIQGLVYLHTRPRPIQHRDLKTENVLLVNGVAKLCDFGISKSGASVNSVSGCKGSENWSPPEVFGYGKSVGLPSDVYSYGVVLWSMLTGQYPYEGLRMSEIGSKVMSGNMLPLPSSCPSNLVALIHKCWERDYERRICAVQVEAELREIQGRSGTTSIVKNAIRSMNSEELVAYFRKKNVLPQFTDTARSNRLTGEDFMELDVDTLMARPFNLTRFQAMQIIELINESHTSDCNPMDKFKLPGIATIGTKLLGRGGQGSVFEGSYLGKPVAVKMVTSANKEIAIQEVLLTTKVSHKNIINIIGVFTSPDNFFCIVMPLATDSLKGYIEKNGRIKSEQLLSFAQHICEALVYCITASPKEPLHHCDLKTENILIVDGVAKVADFGMAITRVKTGTSSLPGATKLVPEDQPEVGGTRHWQGPENFDEVCRSEYKLKEGSDNIGFRGERSDVYAFGLIVWSMMIGQYPFAGILPKEIAPRLIKGQRPDVSVDAPPAIRQLVRACWSQNYKNRPTFSKLNDYINYLTTEPQISIAGIESRLPIAYSPIQEMYHGELYEYLTDKGVPKEEAWKLTHNRVSGDLLMSKDAEGLVKSYGVTRHIAELIVTLVRGTPQPKSLPLSPSSKVEARAIPTKIPSTTNSSRVGEMDTSELVAHMRKLKILDSFVTSLEENEITGSEFLNLTLEELTSYPYSLEERQAKPIFKLIEKSSTA